MHRKGQSSSIRFTASVIMKNASQIDVKKKKKEVNAIPAQRTTNDTTVKKKKKSSFPLRLESQLWETIIVFHIQSAIAARYDPN